MKKEESMPNFIKNEEEILKFWQDNNCFEKLVEKNKNSGKHFKFLDGPITANNGMGVHHAWNRSLKDIPNSNYSINANYIVSAIGSKIDKKFINEFDLELNEKGYVKVNENNMTSKNGIFACGDLIGTKATVAFACRSGRNSAENIVRFLNY